MRALLIVLDSAGVGHAPDAAVYNDAGADTLGHIFERRPGLRLPAMWSLGLGHILRRDPAGELRGSFGQMREQSAGKDSTTGHWEIAGVILDEPFAVFAKFPPQLIDAIEAEAGVRFIGGGPASGTQIIEELGPEHLRSGRPILYTSADSVLQIAVNEGAIPLDRLYEICRIARRHADAYRIGRVIARPFIGSPGSFTRTAHRHDFSIRPPRTVLNAIADAGLPVIAIGKTFDLFAGQGITQSYPTLSNDDGMQRIGEIWPEVREGFVFVNLVDFDVNFGHRRDVAGYAQALAEFDEWLAEFLPSCREDDLLIVTADHGNDPTFRGTDHTREQVPLLVHHARRAVNLGRRDTYADIAATLCEFFALPELWPVGLSFLDRIALRNGIHDHVPSHSSRRASAGRRDHRRADERRSPQPPGAVAGGAACGKSGAAAHPGDLLEPDGSYTGDGAAAGRKAGVADPGQRRGG